MFGGIGKKAKKPAIIEENEPVRAEPAVSPCDDEPAEWSSYSGPEMAAAWYQLESLSLGSGTQLSQPQIEGEDIFQWYLNAASSGDRCAQYTVGKMFHHGILTQALPFQAGIWYSRASEGGSPFADYELAKMSEYGLAMKKNAELAEKLYQRAYQAFLKIEQRDPNRAVEKRLAGLCEKGVTSDPQEAARWRQLAEQQPARPIISEQNTTNALFQQANVEKSENPLDKKGDSNSCCGGRPLKIEYIPAKYISPSKNNDFAKNDTEESIRSCALSIKINGLIEPLIVKKISNTEYKILSGEKRYRAITQYLQWDVIPVIIKEHISANAAHLMLQAANLDVRDYTAGQMLQFYIDKERTLRKMKESGEYTGSIQEGISESLGLSTHQIRKYKRIVDMLPPKRLRQIRNGTLSLAKAYKMTFHEKDSSDKHSKETSNGVSGPGSDLRENPEAKSTEKSGSLPPIPRPQNVFKKAPGPESDLREGSEPKSTVKSGLLPPIPDSQNASKNAPEPESDLREDSEPKSTVKSGLLPPIPDSQSISRNAPGPRSDLRENSEPKLTEKPEPLPPIPHPQNVFKKAPGPESDFQAKFIAKKGHRSISVANITDENTAFEATSVFQNPGSYQEAIDMLTELPVEPGDTCTVIEGGRAIPSVIDRIELYSDALLLSVSFNGTVQSYPVSQIGKTLFIGGEKEAGSA